MAATWVSTMTELYQHGPLAWSRKRNGTAHSTKIFRVRCEWLAGIEQNAHPGLALKMTAGSVLHLLGEGRLVPERLTQRVAVDTPHHPRFHHHLLAREIEEFARLNPSNEQSQHHAGHHLRFPHTAPLY